jgi:serine/threonine protein kinase
MEGGRLVGQGTFGCVFDPPLKCKEARSKAQKGPQVGKIGKPIDAEAELIAAKTLGKIEGASTYFVLADPTSLCTPVVSSKDGIDNCKVVQRYGMKDMVSFAMPYGGVTISNRFNAVKEEGTTFPFQQCIVRLLECGAVLALHGYVHYDISPRNILFDEKTSMPRLIDFGMSFSSSNITAEIIQERWKIYSPGYDVEPPEISVLTGLKKGISLNQTIRDVIKEKGAIQSASVHAGLSTKRQLQSFVEFWNSSKSMKEQDLVAFFKFYWPAFDAWSVGYVILILFRRYVQLTNVHDDPTTFMSIKEILRGLLCMNPRTRIDCVEALAKIDPTSAILTSPAGQKWIYEREQSRGSSS